MKELKLEIEELEERIAPAGLKVTAPGAPPASAPPLAPAILTIGDGGAPPVDLPPGPVAPTVAAAEITT